MSGLVHERYDSSIAERDVDGSGVIRREGWGDAFPLVPNGVDDCHDPKGCRGDDLIE